MSSGSVREPVCDTQFSEHVPEEESDADTDDEDDHETSDQETGVDAAHTRRCPWRDKSVFPRDESAFPRDESVLPVTPA